MEILELFTGILNLIEGIFHLMYFLFSGAFKVFIAGPFIFIGAVAVWFWEGRKPLLWDLMKDYKNALWGLLIVWFVIGCVLLMG